jgi:hypothetical protein
MNKIIVFVLLSMVFNNLSFAQRWTMAKGVSLSAVVNYTPPSVATAGTTLWVAPTVTGGATSLVSATVSDRFITPLVSIQTTIAYDNPSSYWGEYFANQLRLKEAYDITKPLVGFWYGVDKQMIETSFIMPTPPLRVPLVFSYSQPQTSGRRGGVIRSVDELELGLPIVRTITLKD